MQPKWEAASQFQLRMGLTGPMKKVFYYIAVALTIAITSCHRIPIMDIPCAMCDEDDRFVHLSQCNDHSSHTFPSIFSHPSPLQSQDFQTLLEHLHVQSRPDRVLLFGTSGPVIPAFMPDEITYLSSALPAAFSKAGPEQCVVFGLKHTTSDTISEVTTGSWFFSGDQFNIVMVNYRAKITVPEIWDGLRRAPLESAGGMFYDFVPTEYQEVTHAGGRSSHWFRSDVLVLAIVYKQLLLRSIEQADQVTGDKGSSGTASIKEELQRLLELHKEGLISDDQYEQRVKKLIDQL